VIEISAHGRVNLMGEHTDYNGGLVLPMLMPLKTVIQISPTVEDGIIRVESENMPGISSYLLGGEKPSKDWTDYVKGVTWALRISGYSVKSCHVKIRSQIPMGSGLSSSAALEIALLKGFREWMSLPISNQELAKLAQKVENEFVGAHVGIMDPMVISLAEKGQALFINTRTLDYEGVDVSKLEFLIIDSGYSHRLSDAEAGTTHLEVGASYNLRRQECEEAARLLHVGDLSEIQGPVAVDWLKLDEILRRRVRHVITENERVRQAKVALEKGDSKTLGKLFLDSHESQRRDFEVSIPQIDRLVEIAMSLEGVFGARLTGGGFGGSIVAHVQKGRGTQLAAKILEKYQESTRQKARFWIA
jgi:galactokinase